MIKAKQMARIYAKRLSVIQLWMKKEGLKSGESINAIIDEINEYKSQLEKENRKTKPSRISSISPDLEIKHKPKLNPSRKTIIKYKKHRNVEIKKAQNIEGGKLSKQEAEVKPLTITKSLDERKKINLKENIKTKKGLKTKVGDREKPKKKTKAEKKRDKELKEEQRRLRKIDFSKPPKYMKGRIICGFCRLSHYGGREYIRLNGERVIVCNHCRNDKVEWFNPVKPARKSDAMDFIVSGSFGSGKHSR